MSDINNLTKSQRKRRRQAEKRKASGSPSTENGVHNTSSCNVDSPSVTNTELDFYQISDDYVRSVMNYNTSPTMNLEQQNAYGFQTPQPVQQPTDEKDRMMIGRTIMLPDRRWGGIKGVTARTFINTTLDSELSGGRFYLEVKYNGKDLYSNNWELCTLDEDYDDRLIYCPFNPGEYSFVKDRQIPIYLPKGRYETKGWMTNQEEQIIACGFSDFSL